MLAAPDIHPVAQGALVDPQVASDLGDRLAGLEHHLHGFSLELRTELPPLLGHGRILSSQRTCPRSLVHPRQPPRPAARRTDELRPTPAPRPRTDHPDPAQPPLPGHRHRPASRPVPDPRPRPAAPRRTGPARRAHQPPTARSQPRLPDRRGQPRLRIRPGRMKLDSIFPASPVLAFYADL